MVDVAYRELTQYFPRPGWVEHDAAEIWTRRPATLAEVWAPGRRRARRSRPSASRTSARPRSPWTAGRPALRTGHRLAGPAHRRGSATSSRPGGHLASVRARTGLILDPYFSATKMRGSSPRRPGRQPRPRPRDRRRLAAVEPDRGRRRRRFATDASNASRTLLYDIDDAGVVADELCELFGVPDGRLAEVRPVVRALRRVAGGAAPGPAPRRRADQRHRWATSRPPCSASAASSPAWSRSTYGTGTFVLANAGHSARRRRRPARRRWPGTSATTASARSLRPRGLGLHRRGSHPVAARRLG